MGTYPLSHFCIRISLWNVKNSHLCQSMDSEMQTKLSVYLYRQGIVGSDILAVVRNIDRST